MENKYLKEIVMNLIPDGDKETLGGGNDTGGTGSNGGGSGGSDGGD